jgi:pimeloyl-ACP methyl ester carboxylesterase
MTTPRLTEHRIKGFDGTRLYYNSIGRGFPLVCTDGIACDQYAWKYVVQNFSDRCRVIRWNFRGHGRSAKPENFENLSIENVADDLAMVMDDAGLDKAVHLGHSMGVQVIFEFFRRHKDRVAGLVPICGSYGHPLKTFHNNELAYRLFPFIYDAVMKRPRQIEEWWKKIVPTQFSYYVAILTEINRLLVKQEDFMPYLEHVATMDLELFLRMLKFANEHTARDVLPSVDVPTLIFGGEHDSFTPVWLSMDMQKLIPGSEIQILPLGTHTAPIEHPDLLCLRLDKWLREHFPKTYGRAFAKRAAVKRATHKKPVASRQSPVASDQ